MFWGGLEPVQLVLTLIGIRRDQGFLNANQNKEELHPVGHSLNTGDDSLIALYPPLHCAKRKKNKRYHQQFTLDSWCFGDQH